MARPSKAFAAKVLGARFCLLKLYDHHREWFNVLNPSKALLLAYHIRKKFFHWNYIIISIHADNNTWILSIFTGPEARSGHRIVVDEGNIYCYGGYNPTSPTAGSANRGRNMDEFPMFRELWRYNLASNQWEELQTTGSIPNESASYACKDSLDTGLSLYQSSGDKSLAELI